MVAVAAAGRPQTGCPISGDPIDKDHHVDWQGQRIYFCCGKCPDTFRDDPEKYFSRLAADGVELENIQTACPVGGEKLGEGDIGEPVTVSYKGRTVKLCCNMCKPKFEKEPAKYRDAPRRAACPGEIASLLAPGTRLWCEHLARTFGEFPGMRGRDARPFRGPAGMCRRDAGTTIPAGHVPSS